MLEVVVDQHNLLYTFPVLLFLIQGKKNVGVPYMKHIGIYAFRKETLDFFFLSMAPCYH